jgi:hypothetical protein
MYYYISQDIQTSPSIAFRFLRDKEQSYRLGSWSSLVLSLDKLDSGGTRVGTRYRERVRMLPFMTGTILSELVRLEPNRLIEEHWRGPGMEGWLRYTLTPYADGTCLQQEQTLRCRGWLKVLSPFIYLAFGIAIRLRLKGIKALLESM